jgi:hypothetical protein
VTLKMWEVVNIKSNFITNIVLFWLLFPFSSIWKPLEEQILDTNASSCHRCPFFSYGENMKPSLIHIRIISIFSSWLFATLLQTLSSSSSYSLSLVFESYWRSKYAKEETVFSCHRHLIFQWHWKCEKQFNIKFNFI